MLLGFGFPRCLQRGKTQTVSLSIYRDNAKVTPTGCTYQLLDEDGMTSYPRRQERLFPVTVNSQSIQA